MLSACCCRRRQRERPGLRLGAITVLWFGRHESKVPYGRRPQGDWRFLPAPHQESRSTTSGPLFHYTTGAKLIEIIQNGTLWATQAGCLNDEKEPLYSIERFHDRVRASLAAKTYPRS
jgi:hypothetical protein